MIALLSIYGIIALVEIVLIVSFQVNFKRPDRSKPSVTSLSVLVAARNEEKHLPRCLKALLESEYDLSQIEILVGDDNSSDKTWEVIQSYAKSHKSVRGVKMEEEKDGLIAKGNVLAQLVDKASFDKLLIIDADMAVSRKWMSKMSILLDKYDLVSGFTTVAFQEKGKGSVQYFDWAVVLHSMKAMADLIKPISILGNNMAFNRQPYNEIGGFKGLGPTDVEDLGLLRLFQKQGKTTFQYVGNEGSAETLPQSTFKEMLIQRCRWMNGVFTHHWAVGIPALFARLWVPICLLSMTIPGNIDLFILAYGMGINAIKFVQITSKGGGAKILNVFSPFIISLLDTFALLRLILVGKVSWKGRKFK